MPDEQTKAPRTMSAEEEREWCDLYALPDKPHWPGSRMYAELKAERAISAALKTCREYVTHDGCVTVIDNAVVLAETRHE